MTSPLSLFFLFLFFLLYFSKSKTLFPKELFLDSNYIGGLIFGKLIKGPKLTRLSPQKTVAGSLGSFLLSIVTALTFKLFFPFSISSLSLILLGSVVSFGCQVGDIFFSFLKRKAKVKDTGNFLPGHGGILDRFDALIMSIPFVLVYLYIKYCAFL